MNGADELWNTCQKLLGKNLSKKFRMKLEDTLPFEYHWTDFGLTYPTLYIGKVSYGGRKPPINICIIHKNEGIGIGVRSRLENKKGDLKIEAVELSKRIFNAMKNIGIHCVEESEITVKKRMEEENEEWTYIPLNGLKPHFMLAKHLNKKKEKELDKFTNEIVKAINEYVVKFSDRYGI